VSHPLSKDVAVSSLVTPGRSTDRSAPPPAAIGSVHLVATDPVSVRPGAAEPEDLELDRFPLVDVSVAPLDGNPTHSAVSVVRGELDT
jgi:hypothetical protein